MMTDPGYNLVEIVDAVRRAGNPQKAALEALADTDGLTDAVLLDALGVEQWGDLPTVPYPDAPDTAPPIQTDKPGRPRKKPGPKPGGRRKAAPAPEAATRPEPQAAKGDARSIALGLDRAAKLKDELSDGWDSLTQFIMAWEDYLPTDLMDTVKQAGITAAAVLDGMALMEKTIVPTAPAGDKAHF